MGKSQIESQIFSDNVMPNFSQYKTWLKHRDWYYYHHYWYPVQQIFLTFSLLRHGILVVRHISLTSCKPSVHKVFTLILFSAAIYSAT